MFLDKFFKGAAYEAQPIPKRPWTNPEMVGRSASVLQQSRGVCWHLTCILMIFCGAISEPIVGEAIGLPDPPILVPFGITSACRASRLMYVTRADGYSESLLARKEIAEKANDFGIRAFRVGIKFSVGVTLFPAVLSWAVFLMSVAKGQGPNPSQ